MFDTMVFTKALGALCGALLIFLLGQWVANTVIVPGSRDLAPAFVVDTGEEREDTDVAVADDVPEPSLAQAFAMADAVAGTRVWNQCRACHVADDTRNSVGPYLQNVVGRDIGAVDGFRYSGALPEDERWTVENLYAYLENPRGWAPGTSMAFNGLRDQMDRVNVIAFLIDNSPDFDPERDAPAPVDEAALEEDEAPETEVAEEIREEEAIEEEVTEAPAEEAVEEDVAEAPAEEAIEEDVAEAPVEEAIEEEAREEDVAEAPAEDAVEEELAEDAREEEVVEAPAEEAIEEDVAEAPVEEAIEEEAREEEDVAEAPAEDAVEEEVAEAPVEDAVEEEVAEEAAVEEDLSEFARMVAAGDVAAGARVWNQCRACHVADAEQNRVGPHLVGIVGRQANSIEGFRYSGNLPDVVWTLDELDAYLENPRGYAPRTSMAFNGLRNVEDRANVLAYIESLQ